MVTPNQLTVARIVLTPCFFLLFYFGPFLRLLPFSVYSWGLALLFLLAESTDFLDGFLARRHKIVSNLGKIMDPFADIFWRLTLLYSFSLLGLMPVIAFVIIFWRETTMLFVRHLVQAYGNMALPARWTGKVKAITFVVATLYALLLLLFARGEVATVSPSLRLIGQALFSLGAVMAVWSFCSYILRLSSFWRQKK